MGLSQHAPGYTQRKTATWGKTCDLKALFLFHSCKHTWLGPQRNACSAARRQPPPQRNSLPADPRLTPLLTGGPPEAGVDMRPSSSPASTQESALDSRLNDNEHSGSTTRVPDTGLRASPHSASTLRLEEGRRRPQRPQCWPSVGSRAGPRSPWGLTLQPELVAISHGACRVIHFSPPLGDNEA